MLEANAKAKTVVEAGPQGKNFGLNIPGHVTITGVCQSQVLPYMTTLPQYSFEENKPKLCTVIS